MCNVGDHDLIITLHHFTINCLLQTKNVQNCLHASIHIVGSVGTAAALDGNSLGAARCGKGSAGANIILRRTIENVCKSCTGHFLVIHHVSVIHNGVLTAGVNVDIGIQTGKELFNDHMCLHISDHAIGIAGEDAVHVVLINGGIAQTALKTKGACHGHDLDGTMNVIHLQEFHHLAADFDTDGLIAVNASSDTDNRTFAAAKLMDGKLQFKTVAQVVDRNFIILIAAHIILLLYRCEFLN